MSAVPPRGEATGGSVAPSDSARDTTGFGALDAEALYADLLSRIPALITPDTVIVGVWSGGAWLAERLQHDLRRDLKPGGEHGVISSALHRDDFASRGLAGADPTRLPFEVEGSRILLVDDVLYTGRTVRAVINELYDFGRPASIALAVLVDRGGRQLPIEAALSVARVALVPRQRLSLVRDSAGRFAFELG